jgi:transcriptional regulator with XRE-family HTH domain
MIASERLDFMNKKKIAKLEENGWKVGDTTDFLCLSKEEEAYIELKILLAEYLQEKRSERHLTQNQVAALIKSSQSRVAKMEKSDPTVSLDLLVRSLFALGTSKQEIARAISVKKRHSPRINEPIGWHRGISRPYSSRRKNTTDA